MVYITLVYMETIRTGRKEFKQEISGNMICNNYCFFKSKSEQEIIQCRKLFEEYGKL